MGKRYRSKQEMIEYFRWLAYHFSVDAHRNNDQEALGRSRAYEMAAFELERNMED